MIKNIYYLEVLKNFIFKGLNIGLNFLIISIIIKKLGEVDYGIWTTIASIISWLSVSDLGLGNFLRNQVAYKYGKADNSLKSEVNSTFSLITIISFGICIIFIFFYLLGGLKLVFKSENLLSLSGMKGSLYALLCLNFIINFIFGAYKSIAYGLSKSYLIEAANTFNLLLVVILILKYDLNLVSLASIYLLGSVLNNFLIYFWIIKKDNIFKLKLIKVPKKLGVDILATGKNFFILQITGIILFSTDTVIISKILGSFYVAEYSILNKLFDSGVMIYSLLMIPLWSKTAKEFSENNLKWIKKIKKILSILALLFSVVTILVAICSQYIINYWIQDNNFVLSKLDIFIFCIYNILVYLNAIYSNILNGIGKLKVQSKVAIVTAIINIPLSIFFAKNLQLGIGGVKLATFFCVLLGFIVAFFQVEVELKSEGQIKKLD